MVTRMQLVEPRRADIHPDPGHSPTLPGWAYTDPGIFERERENIFHRAWHYAGALADLKEPGDFLTASVIDQDVFVIRDKDGELRGFYNVCRHRAHGLLQGKGRAKVITCPYHAWSYRLDGSLRSARGAEATPGFDMSCFSLKPIRVEVFADHFVFFNLDLEAVPLSEQAADLAQELRSEIPGFNNFTPVGDDWMRSELKANWKVVVDNFLECYHCRPAHPAFADLLEMESYKIAFGKIWSSQKGELRRHDSKAYHVSPDAVIKRARFWWLWPTTTFNSMPGDSTLGVFVMSPTGPETTAQGGRLYGLPGTVQDPARAAYATNVLAPEDNAICESVQRGLHSKGYDAGRFIHDPAGGETNEAAVHQFHRLVAEAVGI